MVRLSHVTLAGFPSGVGWPAYVREAVTPGIVHLGIGAFHRAHQAWYVDACLASGQTDWGIVGVSLRSPETRNALMPQDGLYTLSIRDGDTEHLSVIGSVTGLVVAQERPQALLDILTDPSIRIVTLTVTEKAYLRGASGKLDRANADLLADIANPTEPRTLYGFIVEALARRRAASIAPFTVLSCDNLPANGRTLHDLVVEYSTLRSDELARHIEADVAFPSSMVDRIVPATTQQDRDRISSRLGMTDAGPVVSEPFAQWVVEDNFPTGRPDWEQFGVTMVADVTPYELMKLRMLNGAHSAIAYLGQLLDLQTVPEAFAHPGSAISSMGCGPKLSRPFPQAPDLIHKSMRSGSHGGFPIAHCSIARRKSPMTVRKSCRSASSPPLSSAWPRTAQRNIWSSSSPPGSLLLRQEALRHCFPIRWTHKCAASTSRRRT